VWSGVPIVSLVFGVIRFDLDVLYSWIGVVYIQFSTFFLKSKFLF